MLDKFCWHWALPHHPMPFVCVFWWCNASGIKMDYIKHISHASKIKTKNTKGMEWWGSARCWWGPFTNFSCNLCKHPKFLVVWKRQHMWMYNILHKNPEHEDVCPSLQNELFWLGLWLSSSWLNIMNKSDIVLHNHKSHVIHIWFPVQRLNCISASFLLEEYNIWAFLSNG